MRKLVVLIFFLVQQNIAQGQMTMEGVVQDIETLQPIPYASIEVLHFAIGTTTNADGTFTLKLPEELQHKRIALKISCVGYENLMLTSFELPLVISLHPSYMWLREVIISSEVLEADRIVKKAFQMRSSNYNTKPFLYQTFYRHYCKDDDQYGRLIEAAVDIYKRKGYKRAQAYAGEFDEVKVMQLRRTYDNTKVTISHVPIGLYSIMSTDHVAYQGKKIKQLDEHFQYDISLVERNLSKFTFQLENKTRHDDDEVYHIAYALKQDSMYMKDGIRYPVSYTGNLFVNTENFAIVKSESRIETPFDTLTTASNYKRYKGKYYLYHSLRTGININPSTHASHSYHISLMTTKIELQKFMPFRGKEPGKGILFNVPYDSIFWDDYNILKATPLEESIVADLEKNSPLKSQFQGYAETERDRFLSGQEDEERLLTYLQENMGRVVYVSFWKSDCGSCLRELAYQKRLIEKYKGAVAFVNVSVDNDYFEWRTAIRKYKLSSPYVKQFRIGLDALTLKKYEINLLPHYVLVDKKGFFVHTFARHPTDPDVDGDIDRLLREHFE
jgi:thiol-disulfide isomerase/thioredoxin